MNSNLMTLNWTEIKSALVYAVLTALAAMLVHVIGVGDIFALSVKPIVNIGVLSFAVGMLSLIKNLLTTDKGKFVGVVQVKEPQ